MWLSRLLRQEQRAAARLTGSCERTVMRTLNMQSDIARWPACLRSLAALLLLLPLNPAAADDTMFLIDDRQSADLQSTLGTQWRLITDGVMGGVSRGTLGTGQREAASSLGMTRWQVMRLIVLPQALRLVIPAIERLAAGKLDNLSAEEARILGLWPDNVSNETLRAAQGQIRFQLGQGRAAGENLLERLPGITDHGQRDGPLPAGCLEQGSQLRHMREPRIPVTGLVIAEPDQMHRSTSGCPEQEAMQP